MKIKNIYIYILCIVGLLFIFPILRNINNWGIHDWDEHVFRHAVERDSIIKYIQFPLWNPYHGGGFPSLGNFKSICASPLFLLTIIFNPVIGMKLIAVVCLVIGLIGMFRLAREWGISQAGAYLASFIFMFNSYFPLRVAEGNPEDLAQCWLPWVIMFISRAFENKENALKNCLIASVIFCISCLQSGANQIMFNIFPAVVLFMAGYSTLTRNWKGFLYLVLVFVFAAILGAFRFLPVLETSKTIWHKTYPEENQPKSATVIYYAFLGRDQALDSAARQSKLGGVNAWNWEEFGCYIGWIAVILAMIGIIKPNRKKILLLIMLLFFVLLYLGRNAPFDIWFYMHLFPVYDSLYLPSRCAYMIAFIMAVLAGYGLRNIENLIEYPKFRQIFVFAIPFLVLMDYSVVNRPVFSKIYTVVPQQFKKGDFVQDAQGWVGKRVDNAAYTDLYPKYLKNCGEIDAKGHMMMVKSAIPISSPLYKGECHLLYEDNTAFCKLREFSNNAFWINVRTNRPNVLVINQNYFCGWKVDGVPGTKAEFFEGRISISLPSGDHSIKLYFLPATVVWGFAITAATILLLMLFFKGYRKIFNIGLIIVSALFVLYVIFGIKVPPHIKYVKNAMENNFEKDAKSELENLKIALYYYPNSAYVRARLAQVFYMTKKYNESMKHLQYLTIIRPNTGFAYNFMGDIYREIGRVKAAFDCYKKAIYLNPDNYSSHFGMALIYESCGMFKEAEIELKKVLQIEPHHFLAEQKLKKLRINVNNVP